MPRRFAYNEPPRPPPEPADRLPRIGLIVVDGRRPGGVMEPVTLDVARYRTAALARELGQAWADRFAGDTEPSFATACQHKKAVVDLLAYCDRMGAPAGLPCQTLTAGLLDDWQDDAAVRYRPGRSRMAGQNAGIVFALLRSMAACDPGSVAAGALARARKPAAHPNNDYSEPLPAALAVTEHRGTTLSEWAEYRPRAASGQVRLRAQSPRGAAQPRVGDYGGEARVRVKAIAKHARPVDVSPGAAWLRAGFPRTWHHGTPIPTVAPGRVRADPLTGPIAITERPVLGDQLRRPIIWCEIGPCVGRYEDPVALGEADIRARAIGAGWRHDAVGRLVCPACQQRSPDVWPIFPVVPRARTPAGDYRQHDGHASADVTGGALALMASWLGDFGAGLRTILWPPLLTSPATSPAGHGGDGGHDGQKRENDHGHHRAGADGRHAAGPSRGRWRWPRLPVGGHSPARRACR